MAPNARPHSSHAREPMHNTIMKLNTFKSEQNVIFGVNYSIPKVEAILPFMTAHHSDSVDSTKNQTTTKRCPNDNDHNDEGNGSLQQQQANGTPERKRVSIKTPQSVRKSGRKPKPRRELLPQLEKIRVKYDMNLVSTVEKNEAFVQYWRNEDKKLVENKRQKPPSRGKNGTRSTETNEQSASLQGGSLKPFVGSDSVLWIPSSRSEWEDSVSEMVAVCTSAAFRKYKSNGDYSIPFFPPLSRNYIRDRIDIDDPLEGYQIRHKDGGWLQGFCMFTNFTTWSHYFKWDSLHELSGVSKDKERQWKVDADGSLAIELENQKRCGDPLAGGIVFQSVAEISLIGGLGCGENLLRMALDDIKSRGHYKFVVLQATNASRTFYEKFGFVRVGAISKYGERVKGRKAVHYQPTLTEIVGYRHWTYAHESETSLGKHGGPSYMMALRLEVSESEHQPLYLQSMNQVTVNEKPFIRQLGATLTPMPKRTLNGRFALSAEASMPPLPSLSTDSGASAPPVKPGATRKRRRLSTPAPIPVGSPTPKSEDVQSSPKRPKTPAKANYRFMGERNMLLKPVEGGKSLTYAQKQYQSVWLAVPPTTAVTSRRAPKVRPPIGSIPKRKYTKPVSSGTHTITSTKSSDKHNVKTQSAVTTTKFCDTEKAKAPSALTSTKSANEQDGKARSAATSTKSCKEQDIKAQSAVEATGATTRTGRISRAQDKENIPGMAVKKQKRTTIPKDFPPDQIFFNRVVKHRNCCKGEAYFYVLQFDPKKMTLKLTELARTGLLGGIRAGRPKFKAQVMKKCTIVDSKDYELVEAYQVSKTPFVGNETWDIPEAPSD